MKIGILHPLPLEYYPPVTNAIRFFSQRDDVRVLVLSSENEKERPAHINDRVDVRRFRIGNGTYSLLRRWKNSLTWHWQAAKALAEFAPDVLLYFEPHSALAAAIYYGWYHGTARLFIHHHEYYTASDYRQPGNRLTRINHFFECRFLLPRADWVSQTNSDRLRLFGADHPDVSADKQHVLPNYPPQSWMAELDQTDSRNAGDPAPESSSCYRQVSFRADRQEAFSTGEEGKNSGQLVRLIYVGSVSMCDTFIGPLVEWLLTIPSSGLTLDVFAYNTDKVTREFLRQAHGEIVRFHERGVDYDELPALLRQFDVGVILYRCRTVNYQYNASNKLFEYLMCGLDVWYPPTMLGVKPYARDDAWPRVIEVDFEQLQNLNLRMLQSREGLPHRPWTRSCEAVYEDLLRAMRDSVGRRAAGSAD